MSKQRIGLVVMALATALASAAPAEARMRIGGPLGVLRMVIGHALPRARSHRHYPARVRSASVRDAARAPRQRADVPETAKPTQQVEAKAPPQAEAKASQPGEAPGSKSGRLFGDQTARAQLVAGAALAGWHGGRDSNGWWRHADGDYGWVGPLFWPFAYFDITDYAIRADATSFWNYGYGDIFAGIFAPYGANDQSAYLAQPAAARRGTSITEMCGTDSSAAASAVTDQVRSAITPAEAQREAFDAFAKASVQAVQTILASCPKQTAPAAPARLAAMQQRLQAMTAAVELMRPRLEDLYGLLDEAQKARLDALADDARKASPSKASLAARCGGGRPAPEWPSADIEQILHPSDAQRAALKALQDASVRADEMLKAACPEGDTADEVATAPARLATSERRLDAMQQATGLVLSAIEDLYETLSDAQKAQFESIGPKRAAS